MVMASGGMGDGDGVELGAGRHTSRLRGSRGQAAEDRGNKREESNTPQHERDNLTILHCGRASHERLSSCPNPGYDLVVPPGRSFRQKVIRFKSIYV